MVVYCTVDTSYSWQEFCDGLDQGTVFETLDDVVFDDKKSIIIREPVDVFELVEIENLDRTIEINVVLLPILVLILETLYKDSYFNETKNALVANRRWLLKYLRKSSAKISISNAITTYSNFSCNTEFSAFDIYGKTISLKCDDCTYLLGFFEYHDDISLSALESALEPYGYNEVEFSQRKIDIEQFKKLRNDTVSALEFNNTLKQLFVVQEAFEYTIDNQIENEKELKDSLEKLEKRKTKEVLSLERKLLKKQSEEQKLRSQVAEFNIYKRSFLWKIYNLSSPLLVRLIKRHDKNSKLLTEIKSLYSSAYFDPDWYINTYPDVASSFVDPAEHYLRFGASEGRNPSPKFNTNWYMSTYPDVLQSKINPLIHFIEFGENEQRMPRPLNTI